MHIGRSLGSLFLLRHQTPFKWGSSDCLTWAAECAIAVTGADPIAHLRGRYSTAIGARRILRREGLNDVADLAAALWPEIPIAHARIGDWAAVPDPDGAATLAVVFGDRLACRGEAGLGFLPLMAARRAWRVEVQACRS